MSAISSRIDAFLLIRIFVMLRGLDVMQSSGHRKIPTRASTTARGRKLKKLELDLDKVKRSYKKRTQPPKRVADSSGKKSIDPPDSLLGEKMVAVKKLKLGEHSSFDIGYHSRALKQIWAKSPQEESTDEIAVNEELRNFVDNSKPLIQGRSTSHIRRAGDETKSKEKQAWEKHISARMLAPEIDEKNYFDDKYEMPYNSSFDSLGQEILGVHEVAIVYNPDKIVDKTSTKSVINEEYPKVLLSSSANKNQIEYLDSEPKKVLAPSFLIVLCTFLSFWFFLAIV